MSIGYAWEKLHQAITEMATGTDFLQERLYNAFVYDIIYIKPEDLPKELRLKLEAIRRRLTAVSADGDDESAAATVAQMTDEEAGEVAQQIVSLYEEVARF